MASPRVSIISPTYNHAKFISACIDSVLQQSFSDWEMIVINDGSTDDTAALVKRIAASEPRIKLIDQKNKGVFRLGETYNTALAAATGEFIGILEGDDTWMPHKLATQVALLDNNPDAVMAWGQVAVVNHDLSETFNINPIPDEHNESQLNNIPTGSIIELTTLGIWIAPQTVLMRNEKLKAIGGFIQSHGMPLVDFPTFLELSLHGRFIFQSEVLGSWRMYSTQTTKKYTTHIYIGRNEFIKAHLKKLNYLTVEKENAIKRFYAQACLEAFARSGRYKLLRREFSEARKDYRKAIFSPVKGKWLWRLRALTGLALSYLHLDVEWLAGLLGKRTYKNPEQ